MFFRCLYGTSRGIGTDQGWTGRRHALYFIFMIDDLNSRARDVFRQLVDAYLGSGEPVGSRTLSRLSALGLSPASIRNVMSDLEAEGLLYAPHPSAGRLPTQKGLRFYVDGLMEVGNLSDDERQSIMAECATQGLSAPALLERASVMLSGMAAGVGLVIAPKADRVIKQVQLIKLEPGRALVVLVGSDGVPENRLINVDPTLPDDIWERANNYLRAKLANQSLHDARAAILRDIQNDRHALGALTASLIQSGLAVDGPQSSGMIIVRGQSKLLQDVRALADLDHARDLFARLEEQDMMLGLLDAVQDGQGVQVFIGTEHQMFNSSGWSMVISPYRDGAKQVVGAIGVIGPSRLNYGRIVPIVDYTSQVVSRLMNDGFQTQD